MSNETSLTTSISVPTAPMKKNRHGEYEIDVDALIADNLALRNELHRMDVKSIGYVADIDDMKREMKALRIVFAMPPEISFAAFSKRLLKIYSQWLEIPAKEREILRLNNNILGILKMFEIEYDDDFIISTEATKRHFKTISKEYMELKHPVIASDKVDDFASKKPKQLPKKS